MLLVAAEQECRVACERSGHAVPGMLIQTHLEGANLQGAHVPPRCREFRSSHRTRVDADDLAPVSLDVGSVADNVGRRAASVSVNLGRNVPRFRAQAPMISVRYSWGLGGFAGLAVLCFAALGATEHRGSWHQSGC